MVNLTPINIAKYVLIESMCSNPSKIGSLEKKAAAKGAPINLNPPTTKEEVLTGLLRDKNPVLEQAWYLLLK